MQDIISILTSKDDKLCTYEENGENPELVIYKKRSKNKNLIEEAK